MEIANVLIWNVCMGCNVRKKNFDSWNFCSFLLTLLSVVLFTKRIQGVVHEPQFRVNHDGVATNYFVIDFLENDQFSNLLNSESKYCISGKVSWISDRSYALQKVSIVFQNVSVEFQLISIEFQNWHFCPENVCYVAEM